MPHAVTVKQRNVELKAVACCAHSFHRARYENRESHIRTILSRQDPDVGTQYRSVISYHSPEQKAAAKVSKEKIDQSERFRSPVVTQIEPAMKFWRAEEYHQRYLEKRGQSHCAI